MMRAMTRKVALGFVTLLIAASCGGGGDDDGDGNGVGNGSNSGSGGFASNFNVDGTGANGVGANGAGANGAGATPAGCAPTPDETGCVGEAFEGESIPLDMYIMFDLSCSMSCDLERAGCCRNSSDPVPRAQWRIQPVRTAVKEFLQDPASAGIGVGLGFFGDHPVDAPDDPQTCTVENHTDAAVEIARLPGAANKLITELNAGEPQGGTPTHLAIDGSCEHVREWRRTHPSHQVVILLVTDGIPEHSCDATIQLATAAARRCFDGGDGFKTYVLGVVANNNNSLQQLNQIAAAGGTTRAYLTRTNDVAGSVLEALNAIRLDAAIPCVLEIPPPRTGEVLDLTKVNVGICDAERAVVRTPKVESAAACGDHAGWYYDDPSSPTAIHLCDVSCETVSTPGASLFYSVGCATDTDIF